MSIELLSEENISSLFTRGDIVFKIASSFQRGDRTIFRDVSIVTTKEDYENRLYSHQYNPLLFTVSMPMRLGYLYGCLNRTYRQPREETFVFYWRELGKDEWRPWFRIRPYLESPYRETPARLDQISGATDSL